MRTLCLLFLGAVLSAAVVPAGFEETRIADGLDPTGLATLPDGRLLVTEKVGRLRLVADGALRPEPLIDLSATIDNSHERGLLNVAVAPDFVTSKAIYLYYTVAGEPAHNRISRFRLDGNTVAAASEVPICELPALGRVGYHNGGGLAFGRDGKLYIGVGENTVGPRAQDVGNRMGKILRLNPDGSCPTDNPFFAAGDAERSAVWCLGLRNPFALAVQPGTGRIFVNDIGAANAEEVNEAVAGANFGWPLIEGFRANQAAPAGYRDPLHAYDHGQGLAIVGATFYQPARPGPKAFPTEWNGRYLFADYTHWIAWIDPAAPTVRHAFLTGVNRPIALAVADDGALWYLERAGIPGGSPAANKASRNGALYRVTGGAPVAGPPHRVVMTQHPVSGFVGAALDRVEVRVVDREGRLTDTAIPVTMVMASKGGDLGGTVTVTTRQGVARFDDLRVPTPAHGHRIRATAQGLEPAVSGGMTINGGSLRPRAQPAAGTYTGPVTVSLISNQAGAVTHVTTDGSEPSPSSPVYVQPLPVSATTTLKALAVLKGQAPSAVVSFTYTISGSTPYGMATRPPVQGVHLPPVAAEAPATLSATGLFTDVATLTAAPGVVPYGVNSPLWSDAAEKQRWVALPPGEVIGFTPTGSWDWPQGTVFVKHFALPTGPGAQAVRRRLETRVLVYQPEGSSTYGVTYRWRDDGREADLVAATGRDEDVTGPQGRQTWHYPSQTQCLQCHQAPAGFILGPSTRQLNGTLTYPGGITDHQLRTWSALGMFRKPLAEGSWTALPKLVSLDETSAPLEHRVRSYLDANCAACHRPSGSPAAWDARFDTPLAQQGIVNGEVRDTQGGPALRVVAPGDLDHSSLYQRLAAPDGPQRMPPLGRNVVHHEALTAVAAWIRTLPTKGSP